VPWHGTLLLAVLCAADIAAWRSSSLPKWVAYDHNFRISAVISEQTTADEQHRPVLLGAFTGDSNLLLKQAL
jgi:hypothetical protein